MLRRAGSSRRCAAGAGEGPGRKLSGKVFPKMISIPYLFSQIDQLPNYMRWIKFLFFAFIALAATVLLDTHHPFGSSLPRLGKLLSPAHGFWKQAEKAKPAASLSFKQEALSAPVEVVFDGRMVPHIFAQNVNDAVFVQGYVTASLRLWQMDLATRAASGRLSEVLGEQTLEYDRMQRRKGMVHAAQNALEGVRSHQEEYGILESYTAGVNAYIASLDPTQYPLEYKLLNAAPEPWTPLKCMLMTKRMAETLCARHTDIPATNTKGLLGEELFNFLFPEQNPKQSPIIPENVPWDFKPLAPVPAQTAEPMMIGQRWEQPSLPMPPPFLGSNNWAVSGDKTASGQPILANDPHLELSFPSIWFEIQLNIPGINAYGVSLPGLPGIIIGFNESVAWGVTNVGHDVTDWYAVKWLDEGKTRYILDDKPMQVRQVVEEIKVAGKKQPVLDTVKYTVWGPIPYEEPSSPYYDLAMRWLAHDRPDEKPFYDVGTFMRLMQAKNYDDYFNALGGFDTPAQNFVFASRDGDIALTVNGKFPVRQPGQGRFVQDGSFSGNAWQQFIPRDQVPRVRNPQRGFVSSANQHSTAPSYPYYYIGEFDDYRGRILNRLLEQMDDVTVEDMMQLQSNNYSIVAEESVPLILRHLEGASLNKQESALKAELSKWDFNYRKAAKAPLILKAVLDSAFVLTFDELFERPDSMETLAPELWRFLELLDQHAEHPIFDHLKSKEKEQAKDIVQKAFRLAAAAWYEPLMQGKEDWGKFNGAKINHLLRLPAFSRTLYTDGYNNALNAVRGSHGPSWRMIVELGKDGVTAYGVYPGGQSGNPGSPFYDSMVDQWANGQYNRLAFMASAKDKPEKVLSVWGFSPAKK